MLHVYQDMQCLSSTINSFTINSTQALPNETSPHFTLATQGLAYAGGQAAEVLFHTTDCLCEDNRIDWCITDTNSELWKTSFWGAGGLGSGVGVGAQAGAKHHIKQGRHQAGQ
jgi:hypothetical protein